MEVTVLWSDSAIAELQAIHDYYLTTASFKIAQKIVNSIADKSLLLSQNPRMGQIELNASVFDCTQNPEKLVKRT